MDTFIAIVDRVQELVEAAEKKDTTNKLLMVDTFLEARLAMLEETGDAALTAFNHALCLDRFWMILHEEDVLKTVKRMILVPMLYIVSTCRPERIDLYMFDDDLKDKFDLAVQSADRYYSQSRSSLKICRLPLRGCVCGILIHMVLLAALHVLM